MGLSIFVVASYFVLASYLVKNMSAIVIIAWIEDDVRVRDESS